MLLTFEEPLMYYIPLVTENLGRLSAEDQAQAVIPSEGVRELL